MNDLTGTSWQRRGSTILYDSEEIQKLLELKSMVSLQEFLTWDGNIPDDPPIPEDSETILVCGLETVLESLSPKDAQEFLQRKIRPVIKNVQDIWTNTGIVFGFSQGSSRFQETHGIQDEVLFLLSDGEEIHISEGLWDGTADQNMQRVMSSFITDSQKITIGYHVKRIS